MTDEYKVPVHVPTREELDGCVVRRAHASGEVAEPTPGGDESGASLLTPKAEAFLKHAANPAHWDMGMEERWAAIHVESGSVKRNILRELHGLGLIRQEKRGSCRTVYIYRRGWEYLGLTPPKGLGRGGTLHQHWVKRLRGLFERKGYDVRVEIEMGPEKKRVDLVAFGERTIGVEVAMTSASQEIKNLTADLRSGVLDLVLVASPDRDLLTQIRKRVDEDAYLRAHKSRISFHRLEEEARK